MPTLINIYTRYGYTRQSANYIGTCKWQSLPTLTKLECQVNRDLDKKQVPCIYSKATRPIRRFEFFRSVLKFDSYMVCVRCRLVLTLRRISWSCRIEMWSILPAQNFPKNFFAPSIRRSWITNGHRWSTLLRENRSRFSTSTTCETAKQW